ncbi:MAG: serine/threonine-protein kinase [Persicimonas sp.]
MGSATKQRVLRSGVTVADKYRIDEAIARGGFSIIYRGTHIEMERPVALKLLMTDDDIQASWLERFTREARLASQLTHPNTVTIYDYGQDARGFLYIAMEWVEGESLYRHLESHGPMAPAEVARISKWILSSLQEAHQRGFLHRDLKPSNIMLTTDYEGRDTIKVLDFGIAKTLEDQPDARITHDGGFVGTPRYAAPEQLEDRELTPASDIYSLGLLMWEALVGDPPVPSIHYAECVAKHLSDEPWQLPASAQCPPGLAQIVHRALEKNVQRRYSRCRAMHQDLVDWLESPEAQRVGQADLLTGESFVTLADESSVEEDDDLFAGLEEESEDTDEPPVAIYGPGDDHLDEPDEARNAPDPLERELMEMAGASASDRRSSARPAADRTSGSSDALAGGSKARRARKSSPREREVEKDGGSTSSSSGSKLWHRGLWAGLAIVFLIIGAVTAHALYTAISEARAEAADEEGRGEGDEAASDEEELDDGLPSVSADTFFLGLQRTGWQPVGKRKEAETSEYAQTDARFTRRGDTVGVTVYETDDARAAVRLVESTEKPARATRFGETVIEVAPGEDDSSEAVDRFMSTVSEMQHIARER